MVLITYLLLFVLWCCYKLRQKAISIFLTVIMGKENRYLNMPFLELKLIKYLVQYEF